MGRKQADPGRKKNLKRRIPLKIRGGGVGLRGGFGGVSGVIKRKIEYRRDNGDGRRKRRRIYREKQTVCALYPNKRANKGRGAKFPLAKAYGKETILIRPQKRSGIGGKDPRRCRKQKKEISREGCLNESGGLGGILRSNE